MKVDSDQEFECAIVGGGPGGLVAALYLSRFRRKIILFNEGKPRAAWIPKTHNLIGYHRGISGKTLLRNLGKQVRDMKVPLVKAQATIMRSGKFFLIQTSGGTYRAKKVILATGIEDVQPKVANLKELRTSGLLRYCPICDGFENRNLNIGMLVANEECVRQALFLSHYSRHLTVLMPRSVPLSAKRRGQLKKIGVAVSKGSVSEIQANRTGSGLYVRLGKINLPFDAAYVELGFRVRDEAFRKIRGLKRTGKGLLRTTGEQRTSVKGLFAVGDCVNGLAQISVAAGHAAVAATAVHNDLLDED